MAYILPQVQVFQEFGVLPTAVVQNLNAFVFGPNYQLFRYAEDSEKELIGLGAYDKDNDIAYPWPNQPVDSQVDLGYVKLYMEDVLAEYLQIPASTAAPLIMVSAAQRNKLRAAPVISEAENNNVESPFIDTVDGTARYTGYFTGHVDLPEDYYFYAIGGATGGAWDADEHTAVVGTDDARLAYITTEDLAGHVDVLATDNPLQAGVTMQGPDGLALNIDPGGTDNNWISPRVITVADALGTSFFTIAVDMDKIKSIIDQDIDDSHPLQINVTDTGLGGGITVAFDPSTDLDLDLGIEIGVSTLDDIITALEGVSDVAEYFDISDVDGSVGNGALAAATVEDRTATTVVAAGDVAMVPTAMRIRVTPNQYLFASGYGYTNSTHFKSRGVAVGDRVRYQVSVGAETYTGMTKVTGFEADPTLAQVQQPDAKETNQVTQAGDILVQYDGVVVPGGPGDIILRGNDNQRAFDGVNTTLMALSGTKFSGDLSQGVAADTYTVEITTPGVAGTARATVTNASGTYRREQVLIEATGSDDGQIYIGNNLVINFDQGGSDVDAEFQAFDTFTFTQDITAPFTQVSGLSVIESSGTYAGTRNTTYIVEVVRGGVFDRAVNAYDGMSVPSDGITLTPVVDWDDWTGGDLDDEYILKVVAAGSLTTAVFAVESLNGDNSLAVQFAGAGAGNAAAIGNRGLTAYFDADPVIDGFDVGDYWVIKVNAARPQVRISDSAGVDQGSYEVVDNGVDFNLGGWGAQLQFKANANTEFGASANGGLLKGDVFYVAATASTNGALRTLVLADDLPTDAIAGIAADGSVNDDPSEFAIWLYLVKSSIEIDAKKLQSPPDYNWVAAEDDITVNQDIAIQDSSWYNGDGSQPWLPIYSGDLFAQYRALLPNYSTTIQAITDISDVAVELGTIDPDNPLAQGVYNALSNSGDRAVYYMAVPTDDHEGYLRVLDRATLTEDVYAFAPMSRDLQVLNSVEAHINDMSTENNKRWRIGFVGTEMATEASVYDLSKNPVSEEFFCLIADDPTAVGAQYVILTLVDADGDPSPYTQALDDVVVGDKIRVNFATDAWGDSTYEEYEVESVDSNTQLTLKSGPAVPITIPTKVEVWHDYNVQEMAEAVAAVSSGFANRRMYHVFPDVLGAFGVSQTAEFGAAAVAGLCSSVPPQQGLTNIELNGFDDLPRVYSTFNTTQLNKMAEYGTLIIMQDVAGGRIYIRHQVSTNSLSGDLNQTELSVTKNLDSISYYFADRLAPYIGRYNITPELLEVLRVQIKDGLYYLGSFTAVGLLGPQVILDNTSIRTLQQHPTLRDHVVAIVDVQLPYPLNVLELHLVV